MITNSVLARAGSWCGLLALAALAAGCGPGASSASSTSTPSSSTPSTSTRAAASTTTTTEATTSTTTTTAAGVDVQALRAKVHTASGQHYSALWTASSTTGARIAYTMTGRVNLFGGLTGRLTMKVLPGSAKAQTLEMVLTDKQLYARVVKGNRKPKGHWNRRSRQEFANSMSNPDVGPYAELLLSRGPRVVKGKEAVGGVDTVRLSGEVSVEEIRTLDPGLYNRLRAQSVDGFNLDLWVDGTGRVVRLEQWIEVKGVTVHEVLTQTAFAAPITVRKPT